MYDIWVNLEMCELQKQNGYLLLYFLYFCIMPGMVQFFLS